MSLIHLPISTALFSAVDKYVLYRCFQKKVLTCSWTKTHRERASQRGRHKTRGSAYVPREKRASQFTIKINHLIEHYSSQKVFIQFCCESRVFCFLQTGDWKCVITNVCSVGNRLYLKCFRVFFCVVRKRILL